MSQLFNGQLKFKLSRHIAFVLMTLDVSHLLTSGLLFRRENVPYSVVTPETLIQFKSASTPNVDNALLTVLLTV